jgi:hypothetical protein
MIEIRIKSLIIIKTYRGNAISIQSRNQPLLVEGLRDMLKLR